MSEQLFQFSREEVERVNIDTAIFKTTIKESTDTNVVSVELNVDEDRFPYKVELNNGELWVKFKNVNISLDSKEYKQMKTEFNILVTLPSDMKLMSLDVSVSAGMVSIECPNVETRRGKFVTGAGTLRMNGLQILEDSDFDIGAGDAQILGIIYGEDAQSYIKCGVGCVNMETNGKGGYDVDCGVGSVTLRLAESYTYYNYRFSCGLGRIEVNNQKIGKFFGTSQSCQNPGANHLVKVDCGLGAVRVSTN